MELLKFNINVLAEELKNVFNGKNLHKKLYLKIKFCENFGVEFYKVIQSQKKLKKTLNIQIFINRILVFFGF